MTFGNKNLTEKGPIKGIRDFVRTEWQWVSVVMLIISVAFGVGVNYATGAMAATRASDAAIEAKMAAKDVATALTKHITGQDDKDKALNTQLREMDEKLNQLIGRVGLTPASSSGSISLIGPVQPSIISTVTEQ